MTNDGSHTYVYDALNHKVSAKTGSSTLEYVFDAAGRVTSNWPSQTYANEGHIFWDGVKVAVRSQNGAGGPGIVLDPSKSLGRDCAPFIAVLSR